jgi:RNA polymerase sigma factor (sigma-70 family)
MHDRPFPFAVSRDSIVAVMTEDFTLTVQRHHRELRRHCVRLTGSRADADDALQDALLRAWRARRTQSSGSPRAWLYRIATNACFDLIARRRETVPLEDAPSVCVAGADATVVARETVELTLLAALQHLPHRQRAALIMRDVLGWSAEETASALATTVPACNSALQRARVALREQLAGDRLEWRGAQRGPSVSRLLDQVA